MGCPSAPRWRYTARKPCPYSFCELPQNYKLFFRNQKNIYKIPLDSSDSCSRKFLVTMQTTKRRTFFLDGTTYQYRITAAAIKRYEAETERQVSNSLPLTQVVRFLYYVALMLPGSINEEQFYRKGLFSTSKSQGEYSLRGLRSLAITTRKKDHRHQPFPA